jgi:glycosyltransferase involved in cell wall biosynthesis
LNEQVTIVIPCYNEEHRLQKDRLLSFVQTNKEVRVLMVNDGSKDKTAQLLEELHELEPRIDYYHLKENKGKANAVREGMLQAANFNTDKVAFLDADFDIPPEEVLWLIKNMDEKEGVQFAFGSRIKLLSNIIERNKFRHIFGRVFATFTSMSLNLAVYDTQCGCKVFKREQVVRIFEKPFISRWIFDVEIFWRLIHIFGREEITKIALEVPLRACYNTGNSKVKYVEILNFPLELLKIRKHYKKNAIENKQ